MKTQLRLQLQCRDVLFTFVQVHIWLFLQLLALYIPVFIIRLAHSCGVIFSFSFFTSNNNSAHNNVLYISLCTCLPRTQQCSVRNET